MVNCHKSAENKFNIISQRKMLNKRHTHAIFKEIYWLIQGIKLVQSLYTQFKP